MSSHELNGTYVAENVIVTIGPVILSGFSDGDAITITQDEDLYTKRTGIDGEVGRAKNPNRGGSIEIRIMQTSATRKILDALNALDVLASGVTGPWPATVLDTSTGEYTSAGQAWIKTAPPRAYGKDVGERVYVIDCAAITTK